MSEQVQERQSLEEYVESLTGFDEIAIEQAFGFDIFSTLEKKPVMATRALIFVAERRAGAKDTEARKVAMEMRLGDVHAYFPEEQPDVEENEPGSDEGKDDVRPG